MKQPKAGLIQNKRGSVFLLAIGLLSLLVLLLFGMSRHSSGRSRLVSLADQKQTALFALEACYGDIVSQLRVRIKDKDKPLLNSFINATDGQKPDFYYVPGKTLTSLLAELQIDLVSQELVFEKIEPLKYPPIIKFPAHKQPEKKGLMKISCEVSFLNRSYSIDVKVPFKTVFTLTPVLRQFTFFADQIHLEQREHYGLSDKINIVPIRKGANDETTSGSSSDQRLPLCLGMSIKPHDQINTDNEKEGYVYLGKSDQNIILNLAGEVQPGEGDLSDLWQVTPESFKPIDISDKQIVNMTVNTTAGSLQNKTLSIPLKTRNTRANLRLVGFCKELEDQNGPWNKDLKYVLEQDSSFGRYKLNHESLGLSSSLKLLGPSFEAGAVSAKVPYPRNVRNIFGRVFNRFFVLGMFDFPSAHLYTKLLYTTSPSYTPPDGASSFGEKYPFEIESGSYKNYMSRTMSGEPDGKDFDHQNIPANLDKDNNPKIYTFADFEGTDGIKLSEPLDKFAGQWIYDLHNSQLKSDLNKVESSVIGRITRVYRNQEEFKLAAGIDKGKFLVDGVVAIDGNLTLEDLPVTTEIRGGIVLVNGKISLGSILRGFEPPAVPPVQLMLTSGFRDYLKNIEADSILTFISLTGEQITLTNHVQIGVHLISLRQMEAPETMLTYSEPGKVILAGAIAVSTANLEQLTKKFRDELPLFCFPPEMATGEPPMAVVIADSLEGYKYVVR
ncbi:MAG: hypothetical protein KKB51_15325 [Candidatus Riflebacteria bacterium]|nr:hypothetical protein [Candidatus Riflebacteria bacterium]